MAAVGGGTTLMMTTTMNGNNDDFGARRRTTSATLARGGGTACCPLPSHKRVSWTAGGQSPLNWIGALRDDESVVSDQNGIPCG